MKHFQYRTIPSNWNLSDFFFFWNDSDIGFLFFLLLFLSILAKGKIVSQMTGAVRELEEGETTILRKPLFAYFEDIPWNNEA